MNTLYITQENCTLHSSGNHLRLTKVGAELSTIPLVDLCSIVLFESIRVTAPALDLMLSNGVDLIYLTKWGKLKGRIMSAKGGGALLRLAQHSAFLNPERRLDLSKSIVAAKIQNQTSIIQRYQYNNSVHEFDFHLKSLSELIIKLESATTLEEIMGIEGISARYYWEAFRYFLKSPVFKRREYRPSPDYVNALLNLGYSFLANEIGTCLLAHNFDIEIGFLHSIRHGRNSLVLDLMEEFRAPFIDSWLLVLLNKKQIKEDHFHMENNAFRLTADGFKKFCTLYHEHVGSWRSLFQDQSNRLKDALLKGGTYEPYRK